MKIVIIDEEFPYPLNTGKRIRSYNLARGLAKWREVHYFAYGIKDSDSFRHFRETGLNPVAVPPPFRRKEGLRFYARLFLNLFDRDPYIVSSHYNAAYKRRLKETLKELQPDLVICEWTPYAIFLKDIKNIRKIIVAHNIESTIWKLYECNETNSLKKRYITIQRKKVERFEKRCFGWADGATAVTEEEARTISSFGVDYPVAVIENGVDTGFFHPRDSEVDPNMMVFTGSMDWRPNQDAARFFVGKIFPSIKKKRPETHAVFVGRNPPQVIRNLEKTEGITITGTVEDVRPYIARAALYIVPLRIGGGSRLKILEAMAMAKPVLSTSVGASGLNVTDGQNIVISDGAVGFADAAVNLMGDKKLKNKLSENGRQLVLNHYRWEILAGKLHDYIGSIVLK